MDAVISNWSLDGCCQMMSGAGLVEDVLTEACAAAWILYAAGVQ